MGSKIKVKCNLFIERHYFSDSVYRFFHSKKRRSRGVVAVWYDVLYFGGVVLSLPYQLVGTMLSHGARGNSGEKFHPCSARGEESLRRRKLFAGPDLVADFPVIASSSKALVIVSQNEQPTVERSYLTVAVLRRRSMKCCSSNGSFYARLILFFFSKWTICIVYTWK